MAVQIILKNSSIEDKRPQASQLTNGEISLNYSSAGAFLCCTDTNGDVQQVGGVKIDETAPDAPVKQTLWFKPSTLTLSVFDGDKWLPIAGGGGGGGTPGGDIIQIIGNDGIDADTVAGIVTLDVELAGGDDGLEFKSSKLSATLASATDLGSVKVGDNIDVTAGKISVPKATSSTFGVVKLGDGIEIDGDGSINIDVPTTTTYRGSCDLNSPPTGQINPDPALKGDAYINSADAPAVDAGWTGITGSAKIGDLVIFDGTTWDLIPLGNGEAPVTSVNGKTGDVVLDYTDVGAASEAQGELADTALQPGDNISELNNDEGYITEAEAPVLSVNGQTGVVVLDATDVGALAPGDDITELNNNAGYITADDIPVTSVNGKTGDVVLDATDVGALAPGDVDLGYTPAADKGTITNTAGDGTDIPFATTAAAGLITEAATPTSGTVQYARQVTDAGVASWSEIEESSSVSVGASPPADPGVGDLWWDSSDDSGRLYVWYEDADSEQWVETSPAAPPTPETTVYWKKTGNDLEPIEETDNVVIGDGNITLGADGTVVATNRFESGGTISGQFKGLYDAGTAGDDYLASAFVANYAGEDTVNIRYNGAAEFAADVQAKSQNSGQIAGMRNYVINGDARIWQRGTTGFTASGTSNRAYLADRWRAYTIGSGSSITAERSTDVPEGLGFTYSIEATNTGTESSTLSYAIECTDLNDASSAPFIPNQPYTLSYWVKSTNTVTGCTVRFAKTVSGNSAQKWDKETVIQATTGSGEWEQYIATYEFTSFTPNANLKALFLSNIGGYVPNGGVMKVTGLQFEIGPVATPFEHRPLQTELALCQRYFQILNCKWSGYTYSTNSYDQDQTFSYNTTMRAIPTLTGTQSGKVGKSSAFSAAQFVDSCAITFGGGQGNNNEFTRFKWVVQAQSEL